MTASRAPNDSADRSDPALAPELFPKGFSGAWIGMAKTQFLAGHPDIEPFLRDDYYLEDCSADPYRIAGYAFGDQRLHMLQLLADVPAGDADACLREATARLGRPTRTADLPARTLTGKPLHNASPQTPCSVWERPGVWVFLGWTPSHGGEVRVTYMLCDPAEAAALGL